MPELPSSQIDVSKSWSYRFPALSEAASKALAADLAGVIKQGDIVALDGDLGLGKSTFARALLRSRADDAFMEVPSPTFTLVQSYALGETGSKIEISHFDLYRISDFEELYEIGLEESWQTGAALIEWPDRAEDLLPKETLWLRFTLGESDASRQLTLLGDANWGERLQRICEKRSLLISSGWNDGLLQPIKGDLSPRSYDRVHRPPMDGEEEGVNRSEPKTAILMDMPEREPGPKLSDGRRYDLVAHRVTKLAPMVSITEGLADLGLRVPNIHGCDLKAGLMLWEDFGGETLARSQDTPIEERYLATVASLARLHNSDMPKGFAGAGGEAKLCHYDRDAFAIELDVFLDFYWPHVRGAPCADNERAEFAALWQPLLVRLTESEQTLVLRDVQDPNCFWLGESGPKGSVGFIDFQDCLIGPSAYDLAALAMDARITIPDALEAEMRTLYQTKRALTPEQLESFDIAYHLCAAQRTSKNLGAFARASSQLGRDDYLAHIPRGLHYLSKALGHPLLSELKDWYESKGLIIQSAK